MQTLRVAMDVEVAARALMGALKDIGIELPRADYFYPARDVLQACGIIVPDEVVVVQDTTSVFNRGGMFITSKPGDTITITRNPSEPPNSCQSGNSCSDKSILHLQGYELEDECP